MSIFKGNKTKQRWIAARFLGKKDNGRIDSELNAVVAYIYQMPHLSLQPIVDQVYSSCGFKVTPFAMGKESEEYLACTFNLDELKVISRDAKITPTKIGQFITVWKRIDDGPIQPFDATDKINFVVVNVSDGNHFGQFVFPKQVLIDHGVFSNDSKEGKRAIRVYPPWVSPLSKQAIKTQEWQSDYFLTVRKDGQTDLKRTKALFLKQKP